MVSTILNLQAVVALDSLNETTLKRITTGACLSVVGELIPSPAKGQAVEVKVRDLDILGDSDAEKFPLQPKKHSLEFLREIAHLRGTTNTFGAVMRVRMPWPLPYTNFSTTVDFFISTRR